MFVNKTPETIALKECREIGRKIFLRFFGKLK
jgi:hypothetical protein